eukprot:m.73699 g.73699  ORF g.73699 m.73699 type:complete len:876 (+) comp7737_c0_seq4:43-2670(+)
MARRAGKKARKGSESESWQEESEEISSDSDFEQSRPGSQSQSQSQSTPRARAATPARTAKPAPPSGKAKAARAAVAEPGSDLGGTPTHKGQAAGPAPARRGRKPITASDAEDSEEETSVPERKPAGKARADDRRTQRRAPMDATRTPKAAAAPKATSTVAAAAAAVAEDLSDDEAAAPAPKGRKGAASPGKARKGAKAAAPPASETSESADEEEEAAAAEPKKKRAKRGEGRKKKENVDERVDRLHPEINAVWSALAGAEPPKIPPAPQPAALLPQLLPFQCEGVAWMCHQEESSEFRGGILADDMGMGKTIQTIALLLSRPMRPTLVICPTVALLQWRAEIHKHTTPDALSVLVYHGGDRTRDVDELQSIDVVLTTYAVVESDFRRERYNGKKDPLPSPLHAIEWGRIVLDEAHNIKDRSCNTARAVFNLTGEYKWSLTGTPLQNRVGELYSLIRFLRADPYSYYFCKQCECKSVSWSFSDHRNCDDCGHKSMSHFCWWNREILKPIQKYGSLGPGQRAYERLGLLLRAMMLRRTKVGRGDELGLPPRIVYCRRDLFSPEEEDVYEALYSASRTKFVGYVEEGTLLNNYAHIFELLIRMRLAANHPWLVSLRSPDDEGAPVCVICHGEAEDPIVSACKHIFCREDANLYVTSCTGRAQCPSCYRPLTIDLTQPTMQAKAVEKAPSKRKSIVAAMDMAAWQSSTKIEALLEELHRLRSEDRTIKSIVFSQFTGFLDLLEWRLERAGYRCVKLDGRMQPQHRAAAIEAFNTVPELSVFLISLKAGGVALNLTAASRVFLMDPWWNPAAELQAMDRIHRLGQHRPIVVTRFIIENSIESRIDQLQEKKNLLFQSTVGMDEASLNRLTEDDLQFLFVL